MNENKDKLSLMDGEQLQVFGAKANINNTRQICPIA